MMMRNAGYTEKGKSKREMRRGMSGKMNRLIALAVAVLFLMTAVPVAVFSSRTPETERSPETETIAQFSDEEIKMASDISNMTGVKVEEILAMKAKGNTWYEILDALKKTGNIGDEDAEDENAGLPAGYDPGGVARDGHKSDAGDSSAIEMPSDSIPMPSIPENGIKIVRPESPADRIMNEVNGLNPNLAK